MGVMLTIEPHYDIGPWRLGIEAGPYLHRPTWTMDIGYGNIPVGQPGHGLRVETSSQWRVSYVVGAAISRGPVSLRYDYFANGIPTSSGNPYPTGWSGAHMLMASYRF